MDQKINFYQLFKVNTDGSIEPLVVVKIGGVQFGPGVRFGKGVSFSGIDLTQYIGRDFQVENQAGVFVIKGIF